MWIAFKEDDTNAYPASHFQDAGSLFADLSSPRTPDYQPPPGDGRSPQVPEEWDVDSNLPPGIRDLLAETLKNVYYKSHPNILPNDGFPTAKDIEQTYFYLFKYLKMITTDFYKLQPPQEPPIFPWPEFPSVPGTPDANGSEDASLSFWDFLLGIASWVVFIAECIAYVPALLAAGILGPLTWPVREAMYQLIELPLYNMWLSFHWLLEVSGYVLPRPSHISEPLYRLGVGWERNWALLQAELDVVTGGLLAYEPYPGLITAGHEPANDPLYPRDAVTDPAGAVSPLSAGNREPYPRSASKLKSVTV